MMKHFTTEDFRIMPWRNGGGTTTELLRLPDKSGEDFLLRLSVARVETDGPFSNFPGVDRHLIIINGNGCVLNNEIKLSTQSAPYSFPGEMKINCELLEGPLSDFNVMVKRGWKKADVVRKRISDCSGKAMTFLFLIDSNELYQLENESITFPEQDCIIVNLI
jgi:environmental stress-induced protein Ves